MANAKPIIEKANKEGYAIGAFNVASIETFKAIVQAALRLKSPVILEASMGEVGYIGFKQIVALARAYEDEYQLPIILNLDHASDFDACRKAIEAGFDYIHIDGSKLPLEKNISETQKVVELAHKHDLLVEGELDHIQGSSEDHTKESSESLQNPDFYTKTANAKEFVEKTGIDVFASFIGNLHGIYNETTHLRLDILEDLNKALPNTYFSLHGGSGLFDEDVQGAIKRGIIKVNVNSDMRIAFKMTLQEVLNGTNEVAVYKLMPKPIEAVQKIVEQKIMLFGSEGKI